MDKLLINLKQNRSVTPIFGGSQGSTVGYEFGNEITTLSIENLPSVRIEKSLVSHSPKLVLSGSPEDFRQIANVLQGFVSKKPFKYKRYEIFKEKKNVGKLKRKNK